jgi:hypothetical protein
MIEFRLKYFKLNQNLNKERTMRFITILLTAILFIGCDSNINSNLNKSDLTFRGGNVPTLKWVNIGVFGDGINGDIPIPDIFVEIKSGLGQNPDSWDTYDYINGVTLEDGIFYGQININHNYFIVRFNNLGDYSDPTNYTNFFNNIIGDDSWQTLQFSGENGLYLSSVPGDGTGQVRTSKSKQPAGPPPSF